jgi:hypothetical protein
VTCPTGAFILLLATAMGYNIWKRDKTLCRNDIEEQAEASTMRKPSPECQECESPHEANARVRYTFGGQQGPTLSTSGLDRRRSTFVQPHFEDRALSVRRISAHPVTDGLIRLNSFASTLSTGSDHKRVLSIRSDVELFGVVDGTRRLSVVSADDGSRRGSTRRLRNSFDASQDFLESARLSLDVPPTPQIPPHHPFAKKSFSSSLSTLTNASSMEVLQPDDVPYHINRRSPTSAITSSSATLFDDWLGFGSKAPTSSASDLNRPPSEVSGPVEDSNDVRSVDGAKEVMAKRGKRITYLGAVVAQAQGKDVQDPGATAVSAA